MTVDTSAIETQVRRVYLLSDIGKITVEQAQDALALAAKTLEMALTYAETGDPKFAEVRQILDSDQRKA